MRAQRIAGLAACLGLMFAVSEARGQEIRSSFDTSPSVGIELGNPTGIVFKMPLAGGLVGVAAGMGSGTVDGMGFAAHAELLVTPLTLMGGVLPVHVGAGLRYYAHHYDPASVDEISDRHVGVRMPVGLGYRLQSLSMETYVEVAPGWDLGKSASCTLMSGTRSICPHEDDRFFFNFALGARYVF